MSRAYKTPRILDERVTLAGYDGEVRQITIAELGSTPATRMSNVYVSAAGGTTITAPSWTIIGPHAVFAAERVTIATKM